MGCPPTQGLQQTLRQHSDAMLHALAVTDEDFKAREIHILDPQTY
jgi:hypothetical protein